MELWDKESRSSRFMRLPLLDTELVLELRFSLPPATQELERKFKLVA